MRSTSPTGLQSEGIPQNLLQLSPVTQNKCNSSLQIITPNIRKQLQFPFLFTRLFTFFILFMGFSRQKYWSYLPFPSWWEEVTHWKRPWSWERLTAGGKDWRQEEKGTMEDEMVGWHHWPDGHEFEQTPGVGHGQGWHAAVHGVTKTRTWLSDWIELNSPGLTPLPPFNPSGTRFQTSAFAGHPLWNPTRLSIPHKLFNTKSYF